MLCTVAAVAAANGVDQRAETNALVSYSDDDRELAQRNNEVIKLIEEATDFKLQLDLEAAVKSGDTAKMTTVLERKKKMTQRLGKTTATKILQDMQDTLASGAAPSPTRWPLRASRRKRPSVWREQELTTDGHPPRGHPKR
jgi:hypothetical protein